MDVRYIHGVFWRMLMKAKHLLISVLDHFVIRESLTEISRDNYVFRKLLY